MRTLGRKLLPLTDLGAEPANGDSAGACAGVCVDPGRALMGEPGGPVIGVAAPAPAVGRPLSCATGLAPEEDSETPAPGAIWLMPLSRLGPGPVPLDCPTSMSLRR